jgi:TRAP-type mannitol/chloroaromatic compound transport system permease small subunit
MSEPAAPRTALDWLTAVNEWIGRCVAWLTLAMVLVTVLVVTLRYVFDIGFIWLQESITWMHAAVFMLGMAYTLAHDEHVRVDIFYNRFTERGRAWVDLGGVLVLLMPLCLFFLWQSWDYVFGPNGSWLSHEDSRQAGGLPYPATPLLKTFIVAMPTLVALQGLVMAARAVAVLRGRKA